jgi:hypothetical protein
MIKCNILILILVIINFPAQAATTIPFTINMSETVNVTGTPRVAIDVGGVTRYATYASGTGTNTLTFNYAATIGDVDLDGVTLISPMELNGGTIRDLSGNDATLAFTVPNTSNVRVNYPSLGMDFVADADGRYTLNGTAYNDLTSFLTATGGSFTRNSIGTYYDSTGTLQTATANTPRFDYDPITLQPKGILIEEQRTNFVKNSQFNGGAIGVSPTNFVTSGGGSGVTATITAIGTLNGERFLEVNFNGTSTAAGTTFPNLFFTPPMADLVPATSGQVWTGRVRIISESGTSPNPFQIQIAELSAGNVFLNSSNLPIIGGSYQTLTRTLNGASTAFIRFIILTSLTNGQTVNKTIRFSVPQLEQGSFATSYIPTTTATVTRAADVITIPVAGWYNSNSWTLYSEAIRNDNNINNGAWLSQIGEGLRGLTGGSVVLRGNFNAGSGNVINAGQSIKSAAGVSSTGYSIVTNNGSLATGTGTPATATQFTIGFGTTGVSGYLNGTLQKIRNYPLRVANSQLQLMTQ